jgi:hypothetical protein
MTEQKTGIENWVCPICGKGFVGTGPTTVRELWIKRGGFGSVPSEAIVHVKCDAREQGHEQRAKNALRQA